MSKKRRCSSGEACGSTRPGWPTTPASSSLIWFSAISSSDISGSKGKTPGGISSVGKPIVRQRWRISFRPKAKMSSSEKP